MEAPKLNLACGDDYREGYVNCDLRTDCRVDIHCDVRQLPFASESVEEIVAQDILEHHPATATRAMLLEWYRVLRLGGRLSLRVPNLPVLAAILLTPDHSMSPELVIENIYGGHRWGPGGAYDAHHTGWTPAMMRDAIGRAGFFVIDQDEQPNFYTYAVKA